MSALPQLAGYAVIWGQRQEPFVPGVRPGVFQADSYRGTVADRGLMFGHDARFRCASTARRTLSVWSDETGLAFAADPVGSNGEWLVRKIAQREMDAVSIGMQAGFKIETRIFDGHDCDVVTSFRIDEISVVPRGADPWARVWLANADPDEHRERWTGQLAQAWQASWQRNMQARSRERACIPAARFSGALSSSRGIRNRVAAPASVIALMRSPRWEWARNITQAYYQQMDRDMSAKTQPGRR